MHVADGICTWRFGASQYPLGYEKSGDCCNHRLRICRVVSGVTGIHEGILWTRHISQQLWLVGDVPGVH